MSVHVCMRTCISVSKVLYALQEINSDEISLFFFVFFLSRYNFSRRVLSLSDGIISYQNKYLQTNRCVTAWEFSQVLLHVCLCIHIHVHCSREFIESYRYTKFQNFNISTNKIQVLVFIIFPLPVCNREFIDLSKCELLTRNQVPIDSVFEGNFSILIFVSVNFNYRSINFSRKPNDGFSIFGPLIDSPLYEL